MGMTYMFREAFLRKKGLSQELPNRVFYGLNLTVMLLLVSWVVLTLGSILVWGLPHIWDTLASQEVRFAIRLSLETSAVSTILSMLAALPAAYALARLTLPGRELWQILLTLPMALPPLVSGVGLLLFLGSEGLGPWLDRLGLSFVFTPKGIVAAQFFVNFPYMLTMLKAALDGLDRRMEFVARTLGCNAWQAFRRVTLPLLRNALVAAVVMTWSRALGEFGAVLIIAGATRMRTETLPVSLFLNISVGDMDAAMAVGSIIIFISLLSLVLFLRLNRRYGTKTESLIRFAGR